MSDQPSTHNGAPLEYDSNRVGFNNLPDELVALVTSYVDSKDLPKFLQTQRRIVAIAKRYNVDRPAFKEIRLTFTIISNMYQVSCVLNYKDKETTNVFTGDYTSVGEALVDFIGSRARSTDALVIFKNRDSFLLNDTTAEYLTAISNRTDIGRLILPLSLNVNMLPNSFLYFCKQFNSIDFKSAAATEQIACDEVLCKLVESNVVYNYLPTAPANTTLDVSNRLLESIISSGRLCQFEFTYCRTLFTVRGIRQFLETMIGKNYEFDQKFGKIPECERNSALEWYREISDPLYSGLSYQINYEADRFRVYSNTSLALFSIDRNVYF